MDANVQLSAATDAAISSWILKEKVVRIEAACKNRNLEALVELATSPHGLIDDKHRREAWPILLGCHGELQPDSLWTTLPEHRDEGQVKLDVDRAFVYYPNNETEKKIDSRRADLSSLITSILRRHPSLSYFQGYHDIVQVFLLVLGREQAAEPVARMSLLRIRDFMLPTMSGTTPHLRLLPAILHVADAEVEHHLSQTQPFFALSATLTLYAHDIEEYGDIARLFDFLLAYEAAMSIYLYAIIIVSRKTQLLEIEPDEPEMLHFILSKMPKPLDLESLITRTISLYHEHPSETLPHRAWNQISSYSVLKTTRDIHKLTKQTLKGGEKLLGKQAGQIKNMQRMKEMRSRVLKMRRSTGMFGLAIIVGLLSWWFRREGSLGLLTAMWQGLRSFF